MSNKIYESCVFCEKKKLPNRTPYCSNDCKRERKALTVKFWENKPVVEARIAELLEKKPMVHIDLNAELVKEFKAFRVSKWEIGRMLAALVSSGKLRIYPYKHHRTTSFCYIRSAQREEASRLYFEYLHTLPQEARTNVYLRTMEINKAAPEILKLWDKGCELQQISNETKISITRIKDLITKRRG